mmetsp:Transcript_69597/g.225229  ORF Transcript_69597/g.225229 Transcript_69597/m.225229 type:complete len:216 (-) Transcript_69597:965-1612(-)
MHRHVTAHRRGCLLPHRPPGEPEGNGDYPHTERQELPLDDQCPKLRPDVRDHSRPWRGYDTRDQLLEVRRHALDGRQGCGPARAVRLRCPALRGLREVLRVLSGRPAGPGAANTRAYACAHAPTHIATHDAADVATLDSASVCASGDTCHRGSRAGAHPCAHPAKHASARGVCAGPTAHHNAGAGHSPAGPFALFGFRRGLQGDALLQGGGLPVL